jgi:hypothetical protein
MPIVVLAHLLRIGLRDHFRAPAQSTGNGRNFEVSNEPHSKEIK